MWRRRNGESKRDTCVRLGWDLITFAIWLDLQISLTGREKNKLLFLRMEQTKNSIPIRFPKRRAKRICSRHRTSYFCDFVSWCGPLLPLLSITTYLQQVNAILMPAPCMPLPSWTGHNCKQAWPKKSRRHANLKSKGKPQAHYGRVRHRTFEVDSM